MRPLAALNAERTELLGRLWSVLHDISSHYTSKVGDMPEDDLNLFVQVTNHPAFQERLAEGLERERR